MDEAARIYRFLLERKPDVMPAQGLVEVLVLTEGVAAAGAGRGGARLPVRRGLLGGSLFGIGLFGLFGFFGLFGHFDS